MNTSILTKEGIKNTWSMLKQHLTVNQLAEEVGFSRSYVSQCVNGHIYNRKVAERIVYHMEKDIEFAKKSEELKTQINEYK